MMEGSPTHENTRQTRTRLGSCASETSLSLPLSQRAWLLLTFLSFSCPDPDRILGSHLDQVLEAPLVPDETNSRHKENAIQHMS